MSLVRLDRDGRVERARSRRRPARPRWSPTIENSLTNVDSALATLGCGFGEVLDPGDVRPEPVRYADHRYRQPGRRQHGQRKRPCSPRCRPSSSSACRPCRSPTRRRRSLCRCSTKCHRPTRRGRPPRPRQCFRFAFWKCSAFCRFALRRLRGFGSGCIKNGRWRAEFLPEGIASRYAPKRRGIRSNASPSVFPLFENAGVMTRNAGHPDDTTQRCAGSARLDFKSEMTSPGWPALRAMTAKSKPDSPPAFRRRK